ncbi:MAG TPA: hypothetical protein VIJ93_06760, partial [bacterium]
MTDKEFREWILEMRSVIAEAWDKNGLPPKVGPTEDQIKDQFLRLRPFPVRTLEREGGVIRNTQTNLGMAVNSWFPTMMKTEINNPYGSFDGKSIYGHFVKDELIHRCYLYGHRHFKRDSFYAYSRPLYSSQRVQINNKLHTVESCEGFLEWFEANRPELEVTHDYWLKPLMDIDGYTGYAETLTGKEFINISRESMEALNLPDKVKINLTLPDGTRTKIHNDRFQIMFFERGQKIFPVGFKAFRISWCQVPVNYPPLTAKYIYERFLEPLKFQEQIAV